MFYNILLLPPISLDYNAQVVVLIKCVCQLHIVWWNADPLPTKNPLAPARIIGIERNASYADCDLALLLVIFFHRFVLKQMGIWRAVPDEEDAVEEQQLDQQQLAAAENGKRAAATQKKKDAAAAAAVASDDDLPGEKRNDLQLERSANQSEETLEDESTEQLNSSAGGRAETNNLLQNVAALS